MIWPPGAVVWEFFYFARDVFFFSTRNLQAPSSSLGRSPRNFATWSEPVNFINWLQKFGELSPLKKLGPKTCKIWLSKFSLHSDLRRRAASRLALPCTSADHRETSPHNQNLCLFYKLTPKIRGALPPPKKINGGQKHAKFRSIIQPPTLIANISGMAQDIQKRKANVSRSIPPAF